MAINENDIKKVLAYSTISQLGYMFVAVGVGAFAAGIFHLMTHAFFKGLLFLGAGSVIHGMAGNQDMRKMGGLKSPMPITHWTMLAGVAAISGLPLLSGFFSKDEILWHSYSSVFGSNFLYSMGLITAAITAFYMFRLYFMTFHGESLWDREVTPHESPRVMTMPLIVLAALSIMGGYIGIPASLGGGNLFHHFIDLSSTDATGEHVFRLAQMLFSENVLMIFSIAAAVSGLGGAYYLYVKAPALPAKIAAAFRIVHTILSRKYYVDELYRALFVTPLLKGSEAVWRRFDIAAIDGIVNGSGVLMTTAGGVLRRIQTGVVQNYAAVFLAGVILIVLYAYVK